MKAVTDRALLHTMKAFELLRFLDREVPGQLVSTFLFVASHNPCDKQHLEQELKLTSSSASRLTDWLSDYHRLGKPGLGLVKKTKHPHDRRKLIITLTPKGEQLAQQFKETIFGNQNMG